MSLHLNEPATGPQTSLVIPVAGAIGHGSTSLSAFDAALIAVGVANFNLVRLSSVIPPASVVVPSDPSRIDLRSGSRVAGTSGWGDRLYAVWAFESAERLGEEAWAGVAWVQDPHDGRGLFVEHEGRSEATVREELSASLSDLCASRGMEHLEQQEVVVGARCEGTPIGALVLAPYMSEPWVTER